jgi:hypothetical protein
VQSSIISCGTASSAHVNVVELQGDSCQSMADYSLMMAGHKLRAQRSIIPRSTRRTVDLIKSNPSIAKSNEVYQITRANIVLVVKLYMCYSLL